MAAPRPFVVEKIIAVCNGCQGERVFLIDPPLRSADEFIAWQKSPSSPLTRVVLGDKWP